MQKRLDRSGIVRDAWWGYRPFCFLLETFFRQISAASGMRDNVLFFLLVQQRSAVQGAANIFCQG